MSNVGWKKGESLPGRGHSKSKGPVAADGSAT